MKYIIKRQTVTKHTGCIQGSLNLKEQINAFINLK